MPIFNIEIHYQTTTGGGTKRFNEHEAVSEDEAINQCNEITRSGKGIIKVVGGDLRDVTKEVQTRLADDALASYDFGVGVSVVGMGSTGWQHDINDGKDDLTKVVYAKYDGDAPDAGSHKISFHAKFTRGTKTLNESYALSCDNGAEIGMSGKAVISEKLAIGTRIRFTRDLIEPACGDHPRLIYARKGETGTILDYNASEGYMVQADANPGKFGAARHEFDPEAPAPSSGGVPTLDEIAEAKGLDLDDVKFWVGLHYKINFDAEPRTRQDEWIERYCELHELSSEGAASCPVQTSAVSDAVSSFASKFEDFKMGYAGLIHILEEEVAISSQKDRISALFWDSVADLKDKLGSEAANNTSDDKEEQEAAFNEVDHWVSEHTPDEIPLILWMQGVEEGTDAIRAKLKPKRRMP